MREGDTVDPRFVMRTVSLAGVVVFGLTTWQMAFLCDDAFIAFRYSWNLVHHGALVYNVGEYVEGYTSLSWVLLMAVGLAAGIGPELLSPALGIAAGLGTIAAVHVFALRRFADPRAVLAATAGVAFCTPLAAWSTGGLETALFTLLLCLGVWWTVIEPSRFGGLCLGAAALTRPEGIVAVAVLGAWLAWERWARRRTNAALLVWAAGAVGLIALQFLGRYLYYGEWVPNNYYVKAHMWSAWRLGVPYLGWFVAAYPMALTGVIGLAVAVWKRERWAPALAALVGVLWLHVVLAGGDFLDLGRLLVPTVPMLAWGNGHLLIRLPNIRWLNIACAVLLAAHVGASGHFAGRSMAPWSEHGIDSIAWAEIFCEQWTALGRYLGEHAAPGESLITTAAGALPYYSRCTTIDQFGLVNREVAHTEGIRSLRPGHRKLADESLGVELGVNYIIGHPKLTREPTHAPNPDYVAQGYRFVCVRVPNCAPPYWSFHYRPGDPPAGRLNPGP